MTTDLKDRFGLADEVDAPELWSEARRRAAAPEEPTRAAEWPPGAVRRAAVGALAFAVFAFAAVFAWELSHPEQRAPLPPSPVGLEPVDLAAELGPGWTQLPGPPEVLAGSATAWTGSQLLVWGGGGDDYVIGKGYAFAATSRAWRGIPEGPLSPRSQPASAWTGRELLIWGGRTECCNGSTTFMDDGAAYDPDTDTWRKLAPAPIEARTPFSVWTGRELLVWGSQDRDVRYQDGAAYDPATDTWRRIADGPVEITDGTAVWTGTEMIVFGAALHGGNVPESETAIGATYDPRTDTWRELPPSIDTDPNANTAVWADDRLIAVDYDSDAEAFDPVTGRWDRLEPMPLDEGEDVPRAAYADGWTFVNFFGQVAAFSSNTGRWMDLTDLVPGADVPIGSPIAAGGAFLLPTRSYELSEEPNVEFDTTLLVWVPPKDRSGGSLQPEPFVPETQTSGEETRMPVVFPDGSRATLVYPAELRLAELGVQPDVSYIWQDDPPPRYPIVFLHDPIASIVAYVEGNEPITVLDDHEIWAMSDEWESHRNQLQGVWVRLRLDSWTVLVASTTVEDAVAAADYLQVRETRSGFPTVEAVGPLALAEGFGEAEGAQLAFGDASAEPDRVSQLDAAIFLSPDGCNDGSESGGTYGAACLAQGGVFASIYGDRRFVDGVLGGLRVEGFDPAPRPV
jgi:hypothetical protein